MSVDRWSDLGPQKSRFCMAKIGFWGSFCPPPGGGGMVEVNDGSSLPHMWDHLHQNLPSYLQVGGNYNTRSNQICRDFLKILKITYFGWVKWLPPTQIGSTQSPYT